MHNYTQEEIRQRALDRIKQLKETIPGYRELILEQIIEREMFLDALRYNSDLDRQERYQEAEEHKIINTYNCVCAKIKELFK